MGCNFLSYEYFDEIWPRLPAALRENLFRIQIAAKVGTRVPLSLSFSLIATRENHYYLGATYRGGLFRIIRL